MIVEGALVALKRFVVTGAWITTLLLPREGESCQMSCPWPEKLIGPECVCADVHARDSDGGKPMTVVRGAAGSLWIASPAAGPEVAGVPKSDACPAAPPVETESRRPETTIGPRD